MACADPDCLLLSLSFGRTEAVASIAPITATITRHLAFPKQVYPGLEARRRRRKLARQWVSRSAATFSGVRREAAQRRAVA